jgi:hypothetical protein
MANGGSATRRKAGRNSTKGSGAPTTSAADGKGSTRSLGGSLLVGSVLGVVGVLIAFPEYRESVSNAVLGRRSARQWNPVSHRLNALSSFLNPLQNFRIWIKRCCGQRPLASLQCRPLLRGVFVRVNDLRCALLATLCYRATFFLVRRRAPDSIKRAHAHCTLTSAPS